MLQMENEDVVKLLDVKMKSKQIEPCCGPYRNRWFMTKKKGYKDAREKGDETWRFLQFIQDLQPANAVTIRDAGILPTVDEFGESFAG